ncbi:BTAD domain-containing putative transcriptional regulator [Micromonospora sp. WMMD558]|uniref:BTAD domain-containing putative transcriptional regulator n=1 Tax=Micromonospora sp. WMMD558 TaxID=3403462 RepID=UPI003BF536B7
MTGLAGAPAVTFRVLGPLEVADRRGPVPLKGPRQRAVLARLLVARGRVVPVDRLVGDLWETPGDGAVAAIRTFVADLRRALEPGRPARQPGRLLVTTPPGYLLRVPADAVDAWRFEAAVTGSGRSLAEGDAASAADHLAEALAWWRGPAYAEFADTPWARGEINRLDELRMLATERRGEALLALGRSAEAAVELEQHVSARPLREDAWRLWATALYRSGRQADALAALRRARETLAAELGLDPSRRLRRLETDILTQAPGLDLPTPAAGTGRVTTTVPATGTPAGAPAGAGRPGGLVGRDAEQARLRQAAEDVVRGRRPAIALLSGGPGAGKTALAEALTARLGPAGWATAWGRNPEYEGAPAAWPWTQVAEALAPEVPDGPTVVSHADDPALARFRRHRAAVALVTAAAARRPVLLVLDDLHRADEDTLDLLAALLTEPEPVTGPVLVVGVFRATGIGPGLTATLARLARIEPVRVYLDGLDEPATGDLARAVTGADVAPSTVRLLHRRTGGNPFYVRELARLLAAEGTAALDIVPAGVRDVVRHRLAQLPEAARTVLRQASVLGRDLDPEILTALAGDETVVLDAVDAAVRADLLTERGTEGRLRFTHVLVRDTLYGDVSAPRRARWHTAAGEAVERLHPGDVTTLAHHFARAGTRATAARAARYAAAAAERAERLSRPHQATRWWQEALAAQQRIGGDDPGARLASLTGLGRTLAVTGHLAEARRHRAAALTDAERTGDPELTARVLTAFDVPAIWTRNDDEDLSRRVVEAIGPALAALPADRAEQRSRLLSTLALEVRGTTGDRGRRAADEAEAVARRLGNPSLLAYALNARFMHTFARTGLAPQRAAVGAELVDLSRRHELVTFEVLGHLVLLQARCALADLDAADAHADAADRLADRYDLPLVGVFTRWYTALRLAVTGDVAAAETAYRAAEPGLRSAGMSGMDDGLLPLALLSLRLAGPVTAEVDPLRVHADEWRGYAWGPHEPWVRPLTLLAAERPAGAADALRALPESPHDLLREARLCLAARAALILDDRAAMRRTYADLLPAADELAGAGCGLLTLGPVADHLAALAAALGRPDEAADHRRSAAAVTARVAGAAPRAATAG